jgi:hypothetical protein
MPVKSLDQVRTELRDALGAARRDGLMFAAGTLVLTPVVGALLLAPIPLLLMHDRGGATSVDWGTRVVVLADVWLVLLVVIFFAGARAMGGSRWALAAIGALGAAIGVSLISPLREAAPVLFWILWSIPALLMLAFLGHAYEPRDDYYLGWAGGRLDNPLTFRDDLDRGHVALGFLSGLAAMIFKSCAALLGSGWIWRGLADDELRRAAELLVGLAEGRRMSSLLVGDRASWAGILRVLGKLELIAPAGLTFKGEKITGINKWA